MYVCMYVCMYVRTYVYMYACIHKQCAHMKPYITVNICRLLAKCNYCSTLANNVHNDYCVSLLVYVCSYLDGNSRIKFNSDAFDSNPNLTLMYVSDCLHMYV